MWEPAQAAVDEAAQTVPVDTSSVGGFARTVGQNLGAGATRMVFSPFAHPVRTAEGFAKTMQAGLGDVQAQQDISRQMVEPFVRNPSGEAVAALPTAALIASGFRGGAAPEEAAAVEGEAPAAGRTTPPPAEPPQAGGGKKDHVQQDPLKARWWGWSSNPHKASPSSSENETCRSSACRPTCSREGARQHASRTTRSSAARGQSTGGGG